MVVEEGSEVEVGEGHQVGLEEVGGGVIPEAMGIMVGTGVEVIGVGIVLRPLIMGTEEWRIEVGETGIGRGIDLTPMMVGTELRGPSIRTRIETVPELPDPTHPTHLNPPSPSPSLIPSRMTTPIAEADTAVIGLLPPPSPRRG